MRAEVILATRDPNFRNKIVGEAGSLCRVTVIQSISRLLREVEAHRPRVVILDSTLPGVDGLEVLHAVRHITAQDTVVLGVGTLDLTATLGCHHTRQLIPVRRGAKPVTDVLRALLDPSAARRIQAVQYRPEEDTFFVAFRDGKTYELARQVIEADDGSPVVRTRIEDEGDAFVVEQESGNTYDVAWDFVLHHEEPSYPYHRGVRGEGKTNERRAQRIGDRLRRAREERGWSLETLARRAGMHRPNLHRLETGKHLPSLETLDRVAEALGLRIADLVAA